MLRKEHKACVPRDASFEHSGMQAGKGTCERACCAAPRRRPAAAAGTCWRMGKGRASATTMQPRWVVTALHAIPNQRQPRL